tara:strand:+ start:2951 stop:3766 length:816 start_codon:yes stop_codon:yes gene_type:complete
MKKYQAQFNISMILNVLLFVGVMYIITTKDITVHIGIGEITVTDDVIDLTDGVENAVTKPKATNKKKNLTANYVDKTKSKPKSKRYNMSTVLNSEKKLLSLGWTPAQIAKGKLAVAKYINRFDDVAKAEQSKFGIPASIKMAQGLLESDAGESKLALNENAHFGIKCGGGDGCMHEIPCENYHDDDPDDMFRGYDTAWTSWRAHSKFIVAKSTRKFASYGWMVDKYPYHSNNAYKKWARGLKECGYATSKNYSEKLIKIIEVLELDAYDKA